VANDLAGFDPDFFRSSIRNTMIMGLPQNEDERPIFHFPVTGYSYPDGTRLDSEGRPIDPRVKGAPVQKESVRSGSDVDEVACAVDTSLDTSNSSGLVGAYWDTRKQLTVLDTDYAKIADATEVDLSARRYLIQEVSSVGLGPVTVYQLMCFRKGVES
jgi:hypothetical protein